MSEEGSYSFSILPPWYRSWWAYLFYVLLILAGVYGLLRWRVQQLSQRTLELEETVRQRTREVEKQKDRLQEQAERLEELDQVKSRFFTNISHEFRTPLTVIKGMVEQIEKSPHKFLAKGLKMIKSNNANLLDLVNQILDLRKLESGTLQLDLVQANIIYYLRYIVESFRSMAENKNIELHFLSEHRTLVMD
ncbi:MAG: HAMP domain-containing histidine kinase, partial [Saprospiraceae bacterium]|nr:HAMP domain-containing histidine kinase [Saprospiraceae bacterium]